MSVHLDKPFNNNSNIWFSSNDKINGTGARTCNFKYGITADTNTVIITDNLILGTLIKEILDTSVIAFQNISISYMLLKEIQNTNIKNIIFAISKEQSENFKYIIRRVFRDLIPLDYNLDIKYIEKYKNFFDDKFNVTYTLKRIL